MKYLTFVGVTLTFLAVLLSADANAQPRKSARGPAAGGLLAGTMIGGIAAGGHGGAIGGFGVSSVMGKQMEPRRGNHFWFDGRCWIRFGNGEFHPVRRRRC